MKVSFEKLVPPTGESFRCFNRKRLRTTVKWHRHPEIELNYVELGRGTRLVGDHIDTFRDGDLVLVGPDIPHTWLSDDYIGK
ncbi:MAG: cupin domain-containing protein, partial [Planctomycetes bacterium]|nr:cupin domain-containing protein [Planctomycetota bacterium]